MKKLFIFAVAAMFGVMGMSAQTIQGLWKSDASLTEFMSEKDLKKMEVDNFDANLIMKFTEDELNVGTLFTAGEDGTEMEMSIICPGNYIKNDNEIIGIFNTDKIECKVVDIKSDDPEMKSLAEADPATKQLFLNMINAQMAPAFEEFKKPFAPVAEVFKKFNIVVVQTKTMVIEIPTTDGSEPKQLIFRKVSE